MSVEDRPKDRPNTHDLMQRAFKMLERTEGYFAMAAYRELHRPPYERGKSCDELDAIRDLLAEMQKARP